MFRKALSTSILGLGLVVGGNASALTHDFNGAAPGGFVNSSTWDWFPGNALFNNLIPIPDDPGFIIGELVMQGHLEGQFGHTGSEVGNGFGWTYQLTMPVVAQVIATAGGTDFSIFANTGGSFDIWHDTSVSPFSTLAGTGYADGTLIYSADVTPQAATAQPLGNLNIGNAVSGVGGGILDQFEGDSPGYGNGVLTHSATGGLTIELETTFEHADFFPFQSTVNAFGADLTFTTDFSAPFLNTNPSDLVVGIAPDYDGSGGGTGTNNNLCAVGTPCDFQAEGDARTPLPASIPEPASLALLGLGLAGLGLRRKARATS